MARIKSPQDREDGPLFDNSIFHACSIQTVSSEHRNRPNSPRMLAVIRKLRFLMTDNTVSSTPMDSADSS